MQVQGATMKSWLVQRGKQHPKIVAMERSSGEEGASWKDMEGIWERTISARNVREFHSLEGRSKNNSSGRCKVPK